MITSRVSEVCLTKAVRTCRKKTTDSSSTICRAAIFNVSKEGFANLPEGFYRKLSLPFTQTELAKGSQANQAWDELENTRGSAFIAFQPSFLQLLPAEPRLQLLQTLETNFAHEGPVYLPDSNEVFFVSNLKIVDGRDTGELRRLNLQSNTIQQIKPRLPISIPNGACFYGNKIALLLQGRDEGDRMPGGIVLMDPVTGDWEWLLNNFLGLEFNSPNDIVVSPTNLNLLWFTDPRYGRDQTFKGSPQLGSFVWRFEEGVGGVPRMVADDLVRPNGLAFSLDGSVMYVSDTGYIEAGIRAELPKTIYAYDVGGPQKTFLQNRRVFAYSDTGIPDGLKVDHRNNLWAGCGDGLNIWNSEGQLIGKVLIQGGVSNFVFAGKAVIILNEHRIFKLDLV